jgi:hypothetical protein
LPQPRQSMVKNCRQSGGCRTAWQSMGRWQKVKCVQVKYTSCSSGVFQRGRQNLIFWMCSRAVPQSWQVCRLCSRAYDASSSRLTQWACSTVSISKESSATRLTCARSENDMGPRNITLLQAHTQQEHEIPSNRKQWVSSVHAWGLQLPGTSKPTLNSCRTPNHK